MNFAKGDVYVDMIGRLWVLKEIDSIELEDPYGFEPSRKMSTNIFKTAIDIGTFKLAWTGEEAKGWSK